MRMLQAAGVRCVYDAAHSMECAAMLQLPEQTAWLHDCRGAAVKLLNIGRYTPPTGYQYRVIWLDRDPHEQLKSEAKYLDYLKVPRPAQTHQAFRRAASHRWKERDIAIRYWRDVLHAQILPLKFEDLILARVQTTCEIQKFAGLPDGSIGKMIPLIVNRAPKNYDGLLELALMGGDPNA